jgi:hypothetical protein
MNKLKNRAKHNINLLEKADEIALSNLSKKVLKPEYRKVLTNQDDDLKYYLNTYKDANNLPMRIVNQYLYPKYFYYTINSKKNGITPKRTRLDSKIFTKFMQNNTKREMAKSQGIPIDKIMRPKKQSIREHDFNLYGLYGIKEDKYARGKNPASLANLKQYRNL